MKENQTVQLILGEALFGGNLIGLRPFPLLQYSFKDPYAPKRPLGCRLLHQTNCDVIRLHQSFVGNYDFEI